MKPKYCFSILTFFLFHSVLMAQSHIWTGNGGDQDWWNPANWSANTTPDASSDVVIDQSFSVLAHTGPITVTNIGLFGNAVLSLETDFTAFEQFRIENGATLLWNKGGFIGGAVIQNNGAMLLTTTEEKHLTGVNLENSGTIQLLSVGFIRLIDSPKITNTSTGIFNINGGGNLTHQTGNPVFDNEGIVQKVGGSNGAASYMILEMNNGGIIDIGVDQTFLFLSQQSALNNLETGVMSGIGTYDITAPFNTPGTISPAGVNIGTLNFVNNFSLSPQSKLRFDITGTNPGEYDVIAITGFPDLEGDILIDLNYTPTIGDEFTIITASDINSCNLPAQVTNTIGIGTRYLFDVICDNTTVKLKVVEEVLAVNEFLSKKHEFFVQPNPASETINVVFNVSEESTLQSQKFSISIYNVLGQEVKTIESEQQLRQEWGRDFEGKVKQAGALAKANINPEVLDMTLSNGTRLGDHPEIIKGLCKDCKHDV